MEILVYLKIHSLTFIFRKMSNHQQYLDLLMLNNDHRIKSRPHHIIMMTDFEFKRHFRFTKEATLQLTEILTDQLKHDDQRGNPLNPLQQVLICLNILGGGHFQRTGALVAGVAQSTANRIFHNILNVCQ